MCSGFIVIRDVVGKNSSQMVFAEDDDVVQTLSSNAAVESFRIRILPGTMWCREDFFDAHVLDPPSKPIAIDLVTVAKEILRRGVPRKGLNDLLCCPCRGRMFRYCEVNDPTALDGQKKQHVQDLESDGGYHHEIDGHDLPCMVLEERAPGGRRWLWDAYLVFVHG